MLSPLDASRRLLLMKHVLLITLAFIAVVAVAAESGSESRPQGVSSRERIPISETLGLVILPSQPHRESQPAQVNPTALLLAPPANGYFMVKQSGRWQRLVVVEPIRGAGESG
jgi:hypothetical protein